MKTNDLRFAEKENSLSVKERKKQLRIFMKQRRAQNENRDIKEIALLENFKKAILSKTEGAGTKRTFFVYLAYSSEAPTDTLIESLIKDGHEVYCPRIENGQMYAVKFSEDFTLSAYGIREPVGEIFEGNLDVLVMPLLAVDERGNRLGYGGGYYDRFIERYPSAERIAYCYDFQILKEVPTEEPDKRVQKIVTDKRFLEIE